MSNQGIEMDTSLNQKSNLLQVIDNDNTDIKTSTPDEIKERRKRVVRIFRPKR